MFKLQNLFFCLFLARLATAENYGSPVLVVDGTSFVLKDGIESPSVDPSGNLYVGSVAGLYIAKVNVTTGAASIFIPNPNGGSDDNDWRSDGLLAYNDLLNFETKVRKTNGHISVISNVPWPNGIAFDNNGLLYMSTDPVGNGLWQLDPNGVNAPINVMNLSSPMNGFDFGADNKIYGPLNFEALLVKVDPIAKTQTTISSDWLDVEGVRWDAGFHNLYVIDTGTASVYRVNATTGVKTTLVTIPEPVYLDNFRPYKDTIVISESVHNSLIMFNITSGVTSHITPNTPFCLPAGISFNCDTLYIADYIAMKTYDVSTGTLTTFARGGPQPDPTLDVSFGLYSVTASNSYTIWSCPFDGRVQIRDRITNDVITQVPSFGFPYGVAISADEETIIVADYGFGITVWTGTNFATGTNYTFASHSGFTGMTLAETHGFVYVADYDHGEILSFNYHTGALSVIATGLSAPEGIALTNPFHGADHHIIVAEVGREQVVSVNIHSGHKQIIGENIPMGLVAPGPFPAPNLLSGVDIHPYTGDVYVTADLVGSLYKIPLLSGW